MSLTDLPTEILELITTHLDNTSLYSISQISPRLNHIALSFFFQRVYLHGTVKGGTLTLTPKLPRVDAGYTDVSRHTILGAIRSAPWTDDIHTYKLEVWPDVQHAFTDLQEVWGILKRKKECSALELTFSALDEATKFQKHPKSFRRNAEEWAEVLLGLVEEALKKGCKDLRIVDGELFMMAVTKRFSQLRTTSRVVTGSSSPLRAHYELVSCTFQQGLLLRHPFLTRTIRALNNSPHLTSLVFTQQTRLVASQWSQILGPLTCPSLIELRIKGADITYDDLAGFLQRHSDHLRILEVSPPDADGEVITGWDSLRVGKGETPFDSPIMTSVTGGESIASMPKLKKISIFSAYLVMLMNEPPNGRAVSLGSRFPRLKEITLYFDGVAPMERAYRGISSYIDSFKQSGGRSPLKTLVISTSSKHEALLKEFLKQHQVNKGPGKLGNSSSSIAMGILTSLFGSPAATSITTPLVGVRTFRIEFEYIPDKEVLEDLLGFVKDCPDLKDYEIVRCHGPNRTWRHVMYKSTTKLKMVGR